MFYTIFIVGLNLIPILQNIHILIIYTFYFCVQARKTSIQSLESIELSNCRPWEPCTVQKTPSL
jgi:hypothetical protein